MTDSHYGRADDGRVLRTAVAAVMLILAGLCVMAWADYQGDATAPVSVPQQR